MRSKSPRQIIDFRGRPLSAAVPAAGDGYVFDGALWVPSGARAIRETSGPSTLPIGNIAAGQVLSHSGTEIVGIAANAHAHTSSAVSDFSSAAAAAAPVQSVNGMTGDVVVVAGGLTHFTESENTAAPNATIPVDALKAEDAAYTNIDVALVPKGTGALLRDVPDGTATGGNKRGSYAVDLQRSRAGNTQVASGANSVLAGGFWNTASGQYSSVGGGQQNVASGPNSAVAGGHDQTASGGQCAIGGGGANTADGTYSTVPGGYNATTRGLYGRFSYASGLLSTRGDAQWGEHVTRRQTTDATAAILTSDGSPFATGADVNVLPNNHAYLAEVMVIGRSSTGNVLAVRLTAAVKRGASAAATTMSAVTSSIIMDDSAGAWSATLVVSTARGSIEVQVTGAAATTVKWCAVMRTVEVG